MSRHSQYDDNEDARELASEESSEIKFISGNSPQAAFRLSQNLTASHTWIFGQNDSIVTLDNVRKGKNARVSSATVDSLP